MKIVINTLEQINGIEIFPVISLVLFFVIFSVMLYLVITANKSYIDEMKNMPLDDDGDLHYDNNQKN